METPPVLEKPPEDFRPDRFESMNPCGSGPQVELAPGVHLDWQVGEHNQADKLTTGIVRFEPGSLLPYHTHPCSESITVLEGELLVLVEEREYRLGPIDNVTIPAGLPHSSRPAGDGAARAHVALAAASPGRDLVDFDTPPVSMPANTATHDRGERATFVADADQYSPGPNASFIDYFNAELMPGLEMSGGYGRFGPKGRLPAHIHDFDESICIIEGDATCLVEGREYQMDGCCAALQPRGRVHYFVNRSPDFMAMIWVYAGPMPERILVREECGSVPGEAWG